MKFSLFLALIPAVSAFAPGFGVSRTSSSLMSTATGEIMELSKSQNAVGQRMWHIIYPLRAFKTIATDKKRIKPNKTVDRYS